MVGGQRNERNKWIHIFEGYSGVIFFAAINEYDLTLFEDNYSNRFQETLNLFDQILNSRWFVNSNFVLFLNKIDLLKEKLKYSHIEDYCEDYKETIDRIDPNGENDDFENACAYMRGQFESCKSKDSNQTLTIHLHV
eukprot:TRINITY_DN6411_c0_g1_i1.p1 TRINITY_DN6411_c0_g1~~TRINITY_DN6411_c0_g1_i1.p1  ORF type:complete len:137 (-),score=21.26 TRINITY_DN6411_c0_g1_i1:149-559(-)